MRLIITPTKSVTHTALFYRLTVLFHFGLLFVHFLFFFCWLSWLDESRACLFKIVFFSILLHRLLVFCDRWLFIAKNIVIFFFLNGRKRSINYWDCDRRDGDLHTSIFLSIWYSSSVTCSCWPYQTLVVVVFLNAIKRNKNKIVG